MRSAASGPLSALGRKRLGQCLARKRPGLAEGFYTPRPGRDKDRRCANVPARRSRGKGSFFTRMSHRLPTNRRLVDPNNAPLPGG